MMSKKPQVVYNKACAYCGKPFQTITSFQLTCSKECARLRKNKQNREWYKLQKKSDTDTAKKTNDLVKRDFQKESEANRKLTQKAHKLRMQRQVEAKARGMTYGQYVALIGGEFRRYG